MDNKGEQERKRAEVIRGYERAKQEQEMYAQQLKDMEPTSTVKALVEGEKLDLNEIASLYTQKFSKEAWYEPPIINKDGNMEFSFQNEKSAMDFAADIAEKGVPFIMMDKKTGKVVAYSDGDGVLNKNEDGKSLDDVKAELDAAQQQRPGM